MSINKQLLYRSTHRGCKETDFLIGNFAVENLSLMSDSDLKSFQNFLEEDDIKIYDWILGKEPVTEGYKTIILNIQKFHKILA